MQQHTPEDLSDQQGTPALPLAESAGGTATIEAAQAEDVGPIKRILKMLGAGLITGASDDDPSGIGTYTTAGASLGFATLWTALVTFPLWWSCSICVPKSGWSAEEGWPAC